jgi:aspartyl-tRNA(Asn)/glutamyl-tRNA(Gln) amidotransferase subunit A
VRIPAAWCGVVGFKPTHGLVSLERCFPLAPSFDHAGPMARTVEECDDAMRALAPGFEPHRLDSLGDVRVGVAWTDEADPLVRARVEEAASRFPNRTTIQLPPAAKSTYDQFRHEVAIVHAELFAEHADAYGDNVRRKVEWCLAVTDEEAEGAARRREELRERYAEFTQDVDLVLTPTIPFVAPPADADEITFRERAISLTYPFNCVGWPALAVPCGPAEDGLPASLQIVGKPGADALVLAAAIAWASG